MINNNILYIDSFSFDAFNFIIGVTNKGLKYLLRDTNKDDIKDYNLISNKDITTKYITSILKYLNKETNMIDVKLDIEGTNFQKLVWNELINIKYGKTISYSELAILLGNINKTRAVANAISKNKLLIVIPCHRVIGKNKSLTGFNSGLDLKEYLLNIEGNIEYKKL